jgi:DNA-binding transcriptional MocR family regulator
VLGTAGTSAAVAELARLLPQGARVAVESPGYGRITAVLRAAGAEVLPAPVDENGLVVEALPPGLAAVYCTPAHQFPLGRRMSAGRRLALVARAQAEGWLVLEDDYDGELRYDVAPLPLLAALDPSIVAHLGTASKILTPTLGTGWLVAPARVREQLLVRRTATGLFPPRAGQRVLEALAVSGDLGRHLRRLRRELAARRELVVTAVAKAGYIAEGDPAGAHLFVPLPDADAETAVVATAATRGVALDGLRRRRAPEGTGGPTAGLVLGFAGPRRADLHVALDILASVLAAI